MGSSLEELRPYEGEPRATSGWRLTKTGWRLLRRDRTLLSLALLTALALAPPAALILFGSKEGPWGPAPSLAVQIAVNAIGAGLATFFLVAFASAVDAAVDDMPLALDEALDDARRCLGPVVGWTAVTVAAWIGSHLLSEAVSSAWPLVPVGAAWYLATLFVVPEIAIDRLGPLAALRESLRLVADRWREAAGGLIGLAAVATLALLIPGGMLSRASMIHQEGKGTDYALLIAAMALLVAIGAAAAATREAFAVLLAREALDDLPGREYTGRRLRRRAKVGRVLGGVGIAMVLLALIGAVNRDARKTLDAANSPGATYEIVIANPEDVDLPSGSDVIYRGSKVGVVLGSHDEGSELSITFHVEPGIGPQSTPGSFQIVRSRALGPLLVLIPSPGGSGATEIHPV